MLVEVVRCVSAWIFRSHSFLLRARMLYNIIIFNDDAHVCVHVCVSC